MITGRLSSKNPGYIHPRIRRTLTDYLHTLQNTGIAHFSPKITLVLRTYAISRKCNKIAWCGVEIISSIVSTLCSIHYCSISSNIEKTKRICNPILILYRWYVLIPPSGWLDVTPRYQELGVRGVSSFIFELSGVVFSPHIFCCFHPRILPRPLGTFRLCLTVGF